MFLKVDKSKLKNKDGSKTQNCGQISQPANRTKNVSAPKTVRFLRSGKIRQNPWWNLLKTI